MRAAGFIAVGIGLIATVLLIKHYGFGAISATMLSIGWGGFLAVLGIHVGSVALCGIAWFVIVPSDRRPALWVFVWARVIRNAVSDILPFTQIGGSILGMRAATLAGLKARVSVASMIVDVIMELLSQLAYAALALAIFATIRPKSDLIFPITMGLVAAGTFALLWVAMQHRVFRIVGRIAAAALRRLGDFDASGIAAVQSEISNIYRRRSKLVGGFLLHLFAWIISAGEVWVALRFMAMPLSMCSVIAIEGLLSAARGIAFAVPGAIGVQESVYVLLGGLFGLSPDAALALSLIKRARDLVMGVPPLAIWQFVETRRL